MRVQVMFNHPERGNIDTFLMVEDLQDLGRQLRLDPRIQLTSDEDTIYAALPDDTFADIGKILTDIPDEEE